MWDFVRWELAGLFVGLRICGRIGIFQVGALGVGISQHQFHWLYGFCITGLDRWLGFHVLNTGSSGVLGFWGSGVCWRIWVRQWVDKCYSETTTLVARPWGAYRIEVLHRKKIKDTIYKISRDVRFGYLLRMHLTHHEYQCCTRSIG